MQAKNLGQTEKTCRELRLRVYFLTEKANILWKKYDEEEGEGENDQPLNINNNKGKTSEVRSGGDRRTCGNSKETKE